MTLFMDFFDSVSSAILGRVVDRQNSRDAGVMHITSRVTNKAEADRLFKKWAGLLIAKLDTVTGKDE